MGLDARVRYTKRVIKESFVTLINEKPFHKITLTEVCDLSGINRSTFYKHYRDIYDWRDQFEAGLLELTGRFIRESTEACDITELLASQFEVMRNDKDLYHAITSQNFESNIMERILSTVIENTDAEARKYYGSDEAGPRMRWESRYIIKGCLGAFECWVDEGMKEEPEEIARFCAGKIYSSGAKPRT